MKRTPEEIRKAILTASGGDYTDTNNRISEAQYHLISVLIWAECPPEGGWLEVYNRQISELKALETKEISMDNMTHEELMAYMISYCSPKQMIESLEKKIERRIPWDINAVDEYIKNYEA